MKSSTEGREPTELLERPSLVELETAIAEMEAAEARIQGFRDRALTIRENIQATQKEIAEIETELDAADSSGEEHPDEFSITKRLLEARTKLEILESNENRLGRAKLIIDEYRSLSSSIDKVERERNGYLQELEQRCEAAIAEAIGELGCIYVMAVEARGAGRSLMPKHSSSARPSLLDKLAASQNLQKRLGNQPIPEEYRVPSNLALIPHDIREVLGGRARLEFETFTGRKTSLEREELAASPELTPARTI